MKFKDQQLLEEAYLKVNEGKYTDNYGRLKFKPKGKSLSPYDDSARLAAKREEQTAGEEEESIEDWKERTGQKDKQPGEPGFIYSKHGRKYIVAKSKLSNKVYPHSVEFSQGEEIDGERYEIFYKITGVDQQGYPISEPTGKKVKMLPSTEWGSKDVKHVPGFDD